MLIGCASGGHENPLPRARCRRSNSKARSRGLVSHRGLRKNAIAHGHRRLHAAVKLVDVVEARLELHSQRCTRVSSIRFKQNPTRGKVAFQPWSLYWALSAIALTAPLRRRRGAPRRRPGELRWRLRQDRSGARKIGGSQSWRWGRHLVSLYWLEESQSRQSGVRGFIGAVSLGFWRSANSRASKGIRIVVQTSVGA